MGHDMNDELHDYGIHKSGLLVNPYGHWVKDGFNESINEYEDVIRKRVALKEIGNEKNWRKEIDRKVPGTKRKFESDPDTDKSAISKLRIAELQRELDGKKRKIEMKIPDTEVEGNRLKLDVQPDQV